VSEPLLIGDVGGTNARFAIATDNGYTSERVYTCGDFATPEDAIHQYLGDISSAPPANICLAVAGPINDGAVSFTNNNWRLSELRLKASLGATQVRLLNDFEAVAHCVPALGEVDCLQLGPMPPADLSESSFVVAVLGPGTGLGAASLIGLNGAHRAVATEGGHVGFAPESEAQLRVLSRLQSKFERISTERLISGRGIENLYWALGNNNTDSHTLSAAEIFNRTTEDSLALEAVTMFFLILGQVAGDIALAAGAFDGIYLSGGIAQRYADRLANSKFRAGFENKGRHQNLMRNIPTTLITHPQPGLLGAAVAA
jgi:glucokinase